MKLDPSNSRSEERIVYRSIDNFYSPLPYLIGSDKWKEKWHLGLIESNDKLSHTGSACAESIDSSATPLRPESEKMSLPTTELAASQDSLPRSIESSSIGDQMVINSKQGGLFDEPLVSEPSSFKTQATSRNIVNIFDDEPPELPDTSPFVKRKPTNLFDDVESVDSMPTYEPEININQEIQQPSLPHPPVDLFNDNDFDSFIKKIEKNQSETPAIVAKPLSEEKVRSKQEVNVQRDMKNIAEELNRKLQSRGAESSNIKKVEPEINKKTESPKIIVPPVVPQPPKVLEKKQEVKREEPKKEIKQTSKRIMNLFDDDEDDPDDFFTEIIKQKSETKKLSLTSEEAPVIVQPPQKTSSVNITKVEATIARDLKPISTNLFDEDDEDDDTFDDIFKQKSSTPKIVAPQTTENVVNILPDDLRNSLTHKNESVTTQKTSKRLFDDDDDEIFNSNKKSVVPQVGQINENDSSAMLTDDKKTLEELHPKSNINIDVTMSANIVEKSPQPVDEAEKSEVAESLFESEEINSRKSSIHEEIPPIIFEPQDEAESEEQKVPIETKVEFIDEIKDENVINASKIDFSMPLFSDEPPDDDNDLWANDDNNNNFEESDNRNDRSTFSPNSTSFSMPLFDEIPPDDDDQDFRTNPPVLEFDEDSDDFEEKVLPHLEVPKIIEKVKDVEIEDIFESKKEVSQLGDEDKIIKVNEESPLSEQNENKSIITDSKEIINKDEIDKSLPENKNISIKSKLDMFSRPVESIIPKPAETKKLPGKLNMNLNINVNALMPGAKLPIKKVEEESEQVSTTPPIDPENVEAQTSTGLLNNDLAKSKAKIAVKRRPSTRKGRRLHYEKSLTINDSESSHVNSASSPTEQLSSDSDLTKLVIVQTPKNLAPSLFANEVDDEDDFDFLSNFPKLPPAAQSKVVSTSKIAVFYDDEAETKQMLEDQKREMQQSVKADEEVANALRKVESKPIIPAAKIDTSQVKNVSLFGDEDDDDLFSASLKKPKEVAKKPLFGDTIDDEDDDLFGVPSKQSKVLKSVDKKASLFGDESDDDDDLFSSKPKAGES